MSEPTDFAVEFDGVKVTYGDFVAIPDLHLGIREGEFFTFLGPSGCGKTTALRTVAGFVNPARGAVRIKGTDVTRLPSDARGVGMVFQNYALFPSMTVRDNIGYGLRVRRVDRAGRQQRVDDVARRVDLTSAQLDAHVADLSGGQQQRVAIARTMVMQPDILLLDEPLSNLDAKLRVQMRAELKAVQSDFGITTVYVTHDQDEALTMSDRIAVFNQGSIEQVGTPDEVYADPQTEFVCNFVGESSKLSPQVVRNMGLAPTASYVRVERAALAPRTPTAIRVQGRVEDVAYHGMHIRYSVGAVGCTVKVLASPTEHRLQKGDDASIYIDPSDVLQFDDTGRRIQTRVLSHTAVPA